MEDSDDEEEEELDSEMAGFSTNFGRENKGFLEGVG